MEIKGLNDITILVKDLKETTKTYADVFGIKPPVPPSPFSRPNLAIDKPGYRCKLQMLQMPGNWVIELSQPLEDPSVSGEAKALKERGEGHINALSFLVDDVEKAYDEAKAMGLTPMAWGRPLTKQKYFLGTVGEKIITLPGSQIGGTTIDLVQRVGF